MKKALWKDSIKEIKNTYRRFISILLMAFLGVGFFAGIRATSPDMTNTIDKYYKEQNVYDIQVLSTLGLTNNDLEELGKIDEVEKINGMYEKDGILEVDNEEIVVKALALNEINSPKLIDGKMPESQNECIVEESFLEYNNKKIGDEIELEIETTTNDDGEEISFLKENKLKIVGTIKSPLYISRDRGTSKLGAGKVNYYLYINEKNINAKDIYTSIYITLKNSKELKTSSKEYEDYVEEEKDKIEEIKEEREKARYDELVGIATKKLTDAEEELEKQKQDAKSKIEEAEKEIADGKNEIQKAENEIKQNEQKANKEFSNASAQIKNAKNELEKNKKELEQKEAEANKQFQNMETQKKELQGKLEKTSQGLEEVDKNLQEINEALKNPLLPESKKLELENTKKVLEPKKQELETTKQTIENGISQIDTGIASGKQELETAKAKIKAGENEIKTQEKTLANTKSETNKKIANAKQELENSKKTIQDGEEELNKNKQEFDEKIKDAENELNDAKQKISEIEKPSWYILDRYGNAGYTSFIQDTKSIENLGKVFPIIFFLVATLISLTSMTRMVEEQRMQIGTLKALRIWQN